MTFEDRYNPVRSTRFFLYREKYEGPSILLRSNFKDPVDIEPAPLDILELLLTRATAADEDLRFFPVDELLGYLPEPKRPLKTDPRQRLSVHLLAIKTALGTRDGRYCQVIQLKESGYFIAPEVRLWTVAKFKREILDTLPGAPTDEGHPESLVSDPVVPTVVPTVIEAQLPIPCDLPRRSYFTRSVRDEPFVGRTEVLWQIHHSLQGRSPHGSIVAISGGAGVGKSRLANEYCRRFGSHYPGGVFCLQGDSSVEHITDMLSTYGQIDLAPKLGPGEQFAYVLKQLGNRVDQAGPTVLIVLDGFPPSRDIDEVVSIEPSVAMLVTSQRRGLVDLDIRLPLLTLEESLSFLNSDKRSFTMTAAAPLLNLLGGLPLLLTLARRTLRLRRDGVTIDKFVSDLTAPTSSQGWQRFAQSYGDELLAEDAKKAVASIRVNWQQLSSDGEGNPEAADAQFLMRCLTYLASAPVPISLVSRIKALGGATDQSRLLIAVARLDDLCLAERVQLYENSEAILAHSAVLTYVREFDAGDVSTVSSAIGVAICAELQAVHDQLHTDSRPFYAIRPHIIALCAKAATDPDLRVALLVLTAQADLRLGRAREARSLAAQISTLTKTTEVSEDTGFEGLARFVTAQANLLLGLREEFRSPSDPVGPDSQLLPSAIADITLAMQSMGIGNFADAGVYLQEAAKHASEADLGLAAQLSLASVQLAEGRYAEAEATVARVLNTPADAPFGDYLMANASVIRGKLAVARGDYSNAENLLIQAEAHFNCAYATHPSELSAARIGLAQLFYDMGHFERALHFANEAATLLASCDLLDNLVSFAVAGARANALVALGQLTDAETLLQSVETNHAFLASDPRMPHRIAIEDAFGRLFLAREEYDRAIDRFRHALESLQQITTPTHYWLIALQVNLATALSRGGRVRDALPVIEDVETKLTNSYPQTHPTLTKVLYLHGQILMELGEHLEAVSLLEATLVRITKSATDQSELGSVALHLALAFLNLEDFPRAERYAEEALAAFASSGHANIALAQQYLARAKFRLDKYSEAERLLRDALPIFRGQSIGPNAATAATLLLLGLCRLSLGDLVDADKVLTDALNTFENVLPSGHFEITNAQQCLARTKAALERYGDAEMLYRKAQNALSDSPARNSVTAASTLFGLGNALLSKHQVLQAEEALTEAVRIARLCYQPNSSLVF